MNNPADATERAALQRACRLWWTRRNPPLASDTGTTTFQLQVGGDAAGHGYRTMRM